MELPLVWVSQVTGVSRILLLMPIECTVREGRDSCCLQPLNVRPACSSNIAEPVLTDVTWLPDLPSLEMILTCYLHTCLEPDTYILVFASSTAVVHRLHSLCPHSEIQFRAVPFSLHSNGIV